MGVILQFKLFYEKKGANFKILMSDKILVGLFFPLLTIEELFFQPFSFL